MRLCMTVVFLMVLAWTRADPIPAASEVCRSYDHISDKSAILGKLYFQIGLANNIHTQTMLRNTSSVWAHITETEGGLHLTEYKKWNGKCVEIEFNATIHGDTATAHILGMETHIQLRNFSKTAILMNMTASTSKTVIQKIKSHGHDDHAHDAPAQDAPAHDDHAHDAPAQDAPAHDDHAQDAPAQDAPAHDDHAHDDHAHKEDDSLHIHHLFLIGREHEATKEDLENFKEYIKCTEFNAAPDFHFTSDHEYCSEEGSTRIH